jgi:hypothetical protein
MVLPVGRDSRRLLCERTFVTEEAREAAEAEVARRSRIMAGVDDPDGDRLEQAVMEALHELARPSHPAGTVGNANHDPPCT